MEYREDDHVLWLRHEEDDIRETADPSPPYLASRRREAQWLPRNSRQRGPHCAEELPAKS